MIPKVVYQTWKSKNLPFDYQQIVQHNQLLNPEYQFVLFDDNDLNQFFQDDTIPQNWRQAFFKINPCYGPARADLFRYIVIYYYGGIYLDIKVKCRKPFREWIFENDQGLLSYWENLYYQKDRLQNKKGELQNWHVIFEKNHPFLLHVLQEICKRIHQVQNSTHIFGKLGVLEFTGPLIYTKVLEYLLYQNISNPIRFFDSSKVLDYGDSFCGLSTQNHYSFLTEPLFILR
jgi:hypothetical protein